MNSKVSIVIADDHPLLLNGLCDYLISKNYNVVATANNGKEAIDAIQLHHPDLAILDIEMPVKNGFDAAKWIKSEKLNTKVILLSYHKEGGYTAKAKQLNIRAYMVKEDALKNIDECIRQVMAGNLFFSQRIANIDVGAEEQKLMAIERLTPSEKNILKLIAKKMDSQQLAEKLFISKRTVEKHRSNISNKLNLSGKAHELLSWAIQNQSLLEK